jgi:hypothetical protein
MQILFVDRAITLNSLVTKLGRAEVKKSGSRKNPASTPRFLIS